MHRLPVAGMARKVWGDHHRYVMTYFAAYPGLYFTGGGCRRGSDGYYWVTGRVDDVLNVAGHRLGTAEGEPESLGDVSTLADPSVVDAIVRGAKRV